MTPEQREALDLQASGLTRAQIGEKLGITASGVKARLERARESMRADPSISDAAAAGGIEDVSVLSHFWKIVKDENGNGYSLFVKNDQSRISLSDMVRDGIKAALETPPTFEPRPQAGGDHLLVVDLADLHFLKLCRSTETGYEYNSEVAAHRVIEGTKRLLQSAKGFGVGRILFVLGNDLLHVDGAKNTTTSGTPQDTSDQIFGGYRAAMAALRHAIEACAEVADVDLVHCMSNHDWVTGWALAQSLGAVFENHPNVHSSAYSLSEIHRKYYRYGANLFGLTHGDGAKEEKLYGLMVKEARQHISECQNLYWMLHHVHHKIRARRGVDVFQSEKDHTGMTAHVFGSAQPEGGHVNIEYVRSPSPPDGWHDRNGFVNRQGVECFLFHGHDGQRARFTEWF